MSDPHDGIPDERPQRRREYTGSGSTLGVGVLIILVVGVAIWWFEFRTTNPDGIAAEGIGIVALPAEMNPTGQPPAAQEGRAAPNFVLPTPGGGQATLTDYRGKYVLVNFWASWCPPCRGETPDLQRFSESHPEDIIVLGVNVQESEADAQAFVDQFDVTYAILLDEDGEVTDTYRVGYPPISYLVGPNGEILRMYTGVLTPEMLDELAAEYFT